MASKKTKWTLIILVIVLGIGGLYAAAFFVGRSLGGGGGDFASRYLEEVAEEGGGDQKIALINVTGEIFTDPDAATFGATDTNIVDQLDQAIDDDSVAGVVLQINSPGGGVVASDAIYRKVLEVKSEGKPVVAYLGDVAASGGYYIAAGASKVVAHPASTTGSIGVIALLPNIEGAASKLGIEVTVLKSGALKDLGSPFRDLTEQERQVFQTLIDESYDMFLDVVATGRKMDKLKVRSLADGRIYSGKQARDNGLVDDLGDINSAFKEAKKLAGVPDASLVRYSPNYGFTDLFGLAQAAVNKNPLEAAKEETGLSRRPGVSYLWIP